VGEFTMRSGAPIAFDLYQGQARHDDACGRGEAAGGCARFVDRAAPGSAHLRANLQRILLAQNRRLLCASPKYLANAPALRTPSDSGRAADVDDHVPRSLSRREAAAQPVDESTRTLIDGAFSLSESDERLR
jgi:hypothetical protein